MDDLADHLAEQLGYYRARANEYDLDMWQRDSPDDDDLQAQFAEIDAWFSDLTVRGRVLDLGCGTGAWTVRLAERASEVIALDAAPEMLAAARAKTGSFDNIMFRQTDVLTWTPEGVFDLVFTSFLYSHIPHQCEDDFWDVIARSLAVDGTVAILDAAPSRDHEEQWVDRRLGIVRRTLRDGSTHHAFKILRSPQAVADAMEARGWDTDVHVIHDHVLAATGQARRSLQEDSKPSGSP